MAPSSSKVYPQLGDKRSATWSGSFLLQILPSYGSQKSTTSVKFDSQKVCYLGVAPSSSKFYPRVALKRSATLEWHLWCHSFSIFYPRVAHKKRSATLEWPLPLLNFTLRPLGGSQKRYLGTTSKIYRRAPRNQDLLRLDTVKGLLQCFTGCGPRDQGPREQGTKTKGPKDRHLNSKAAIISHGF